MSRFRYRPVKQYLFSPELGNYLSYGIHAFVRTASGCDRAALVYDVSKNAEFVAALAERCIRLQLHPVHLPDVILDAIG